MGKSTPPAGYGDSPSFRTDLQAKGENNRKISAPRSTSSAGPGRKKTESSQLGPLIITNVYNNDDEDEPKVEIN